MVVRVRSTSGNAPLAHCCRLRPAEGRDGDGERERDRQTKRVRDSEGNRERERVRDGGGKRGVIE